MTFLRVFIWETNLFTINNNEIQRRKSIRLPSLSDIKSNCWHGLLSIKISHFMRFLARFWWVNIVYKDIFQEMQQIPVVHQMLTMNYAFNDYFQLYTWSRLGYLTSPCQTQEAIYWCQRASSSVLSIYRFSIRVEKDWCAGGIVPTTRGHSFASSPIKGALKVPPAP